MSQDKAEKLLRLKRRESENRVCVNCEKEAKLGFNSVVEKWGIFVCDLCKSAHQSFSHRVKSVTMSHWSQEEVDSIGGNRKARRRFYASYDPNHHIRRPKPDSDSLAYYKTFIDTVYNQQLFLATSSSSSPSKSSRRKHQHQQQEEFADFQSAFTHETTSQQQHPTTTDLLDFSAPQPNKQVQAFEQDNSCADWADFSSCSSPPPAPTSSTQQQQQQQSTNIMDDFFSNCGPSYAEPTNAPTNTTQFNSFQQFNSFPSSSTSQNSRAMNNVNNVNNAMGGMSLNAQCNNSINSSRSISELMDPMAISNNNNYNHMQRGYQQSNFGYQQQQQQQQQQYQQNRNNANGRAADPFASLKF